MGLLANKKSGFWKLLARVAAGGLAAAFVGGQALAISYPYFTVSGGDVATGGWFDSASQDCTQSGYYQAPDWQGSPPNYTTGGILSFATNARGPRVGSHSQYGAYSLGLVEYNSSTTTPYGFYTGLANNALTFSNYYQLATPATAPTGFSGALGGGLFEGNSNGTNISSTRHCIPDYFDRYLTASSTSTATSLNLYSTFNGQTSPFQFESKVSPGTVTLTGTSPAPCAASTFCIPAGTNYALFVNGNAYITTNIAYASHTDSNIPSFALVVRGNIYVDPNVTRLDGLYVAQPDMTSAATISTSGQFWSCHDGSATAYALSALATTCNKQVTFNGSVVGGSVNLNRLFGGVTVGGGALPTITDGGAAEIFNYTPETAINGAFSSGSSSPSSVGTIDSLTSLPPVF